MGPLFNTHPIREVGLSDLRGSISRQHPGYLEFVIADFHFTGDHWPSVLYDDYPLWTTLLYQVEEAVLADLSRRAVAFGRRMAGLRKEPPPLPIRPEPSPERPFPSRKNRGGIFGTPGRRNLRKSKQRVRGDWTAAEGRNGPRMTPIAQQIGRRNRSLRDSVGSTVQEIGDVARVFFACRRTPMRSLND